MKSKFKDVFHNLYEKDKVKEFIEEIEKLAKETDVLSDIENDIVDFAKLLKRLLF